MTEIKTCSLDNTKECNCSDNGEVCRELFDRYAKVVFCDMKSCFFNQGIAWKHIPDRGKGYVPFNDDSFDGICARHDLALRAREILTDNSKRKRKDAICSMYVDKKHSHGRMLYPDEIHSFVKDEPIDPTSAYHG